MMKKNAFSLLKFSVFCFSLFFLTACSEGEKEIGKWIGIFVGVIAGMIILNMILEYLAIKYAYIYWPACLIASAIIFWLTWTGSLSEIVDLILAHAILLYFLIPNCDDNVEHYTQISYEYDFSYSEWRETSRKSVTETTPGFVLKLVLIGIVGFVAIGVPLIFQNVYLLFIGFGIEGLWALYFSFLGIKRFVKYHR